MAGVGHLAIHVHIAAQYNQEGQGVGDEQDKDVGLCPPGARVHGQTEAGLAIAAHPDQRQGSHGQGVGPATREHVSRSPHAQAFGEVDGVSDGVPPLQGDDRQGEDGQANREGGQEASHLTPSLCLPGNGVGKVHPTGVQVIGGQQEEVGA